MRAISRLSYPVVGLFLFLCAPPQAARAQAPTNATPQQAEYQALVKSLQRDPAAASAADVARLLALGKATGQPQAAAVVLKSVLSQRRDTPPDVLLAAADIAVQAGDLRSGVARYKQVLAEAPQHPRAADARLALCRLLIDTMNSTDDAYRLLAEFGDAGRATPALKRYDGWFLNMARARRDAPAVAQRLAAILADRLPLELERASYWGHLEWLMRELAGARPSNYPAVPACRKLAPLIRNHPVMSARMVFLTEHLAYQASAAGKDAAALERDFAPVAAAAKTYLEAAPTAAAVRDVFRTFGGGYDTWNDAMFNAQFAQKAPLFPAAFNAMAPEERAAIFSPQYVQAENWDPNHWVARLTSRALYAQLATAHADFFRQTPGAHLLPLDVTSTNAAFYKTLSGPLQGIPSRDATIAGALGASDDLAACWQRVLQESGYFTTPGALRETMSYVWNTFNAFPREEARRLPPTYYNASLSRFGAEVLAATPAFVLDEGLASEYLMATWRLLGVEEADRIIERTRKLDWIPYSAKTREDLVRQPRADFNNWANQAREAQRQAKANFDNALKELENARKQREEEAKKQPPPDLAPLDARLAELTKQHDTRKTELAAADAGVARIAPLEAALQQAANPASGDPAKAPNDLCRHLARACGALQQKNGAAFLEAARAAYPLIRTGYAQRQPFQRVVFHYLTATRLDAFDVLDFQLEVMADLLAQASPEAGNGWAADLDTRLRSPGGVAPGNLRDDPALREKALRLNAVYAKALRDGLAKGQFSDAVFSWFRDTRKGNNWKELDRDLDLGEALVARPELLAKPELITGSKDRIEALMWLVRNEFPKLEEKYPVATAFDDRVVAEIKQNRFPLSYWNYGGRDEKKKIANALAEAFGAFPRIPLPYENGPVVLDLQRFWDLQAQALNAEAPVRDAMLTKIEATFGQGRFDGVANGGSRLSYLGVSGPADRKQYFERLAAWVEAREKESVRQGPPSLQAPTAIPAPEWSDVELDTLARLFRYYPESSYNGNWSFALFNTLIDGLVARKRAGELLDLVPVLWATARPYGDGVDRMVGAAAKLAEQGYVELAAAFAATGLDAIGTALRENQRNVLLAIRSKAMSGLLAVVAVERNDRRFPLFQAQADFQVGKYEEAWQGYLANRALFDETFRELDPAFSIWLLGKLTDVGDYGAAEATARTLIQWVDQAPQGFDPEDRARLLLAFAQIPFVRQEFPRARAICEQIATAREFEETLARRDAELKIAEIDRVTKHFGEAIERLERLLKRRDSTTQAEANYQLALVKFDQEEYPEARACLDKALAAEPGHANARILEGKLYLRMKKLVEATEVRVGLASSQQTLVPGKPLKISLEDRNLAVVGQAANIAIRAWTESGDEETFHLLPFGDSKTKFEGQLPTGLGAAKKGDRTLQVLGGDVVRYDFTDQFKRDNRIAAQESVSIRVLSDSELYVSSGRILSREEQEQKRLEQMIRQRLEMERDIASTVALSTVRNDDEVKPGNRINIRVLDGDASRTGEKDSIAVKVTASSGDAVGRVTLRETEPYSGVFEGFVQTDTAQAMAMASDSGEGRLPAYAITAAEYPAWIGLPDNRRPKWFAVDLNNSVALGAMTITADVPGRGLRKFVVQTSPNGETYQTLGAWPVNRQAWTGDLQCVLARYLGPEGGVKLEDIRSYLDAGCEAAGAVPVGAPRTPDLNWAEPVLRETMDRAGMAWDGMGSRCVGRLQAVFHVDGRQRRGFRIAYAKPRGPGREWLLVDGEAGETPALNVQSLGRGLHKIDVYFTATRRDPPAFWLETDNGKPGQWVKCETASFGLPAGAEERAAAESVLATLAPVAFVTNGAAAGVFTVAFPSNHVARAVRLWLLDFETDAPALRKLALTAADGRVVLPTPTDIVKLRDNDRLEIVPGDRVSVTYEDAACINPEKQFNEAFMSVTFRNATLSACNIETEVRPDNTRVPHYIPMRRFKPDEPVNILVFDPDCDTSEAPDTVTLQVKVGGAVRTTVPALETDGHSGIFLGKIFPVPGEPQRPTEVKLAPNEDLTVLYRDAENTDPGIPWDRTVTLEQAGSAAPELRVYQFTTRLLSSQELASVSAVAVARKVEESVPVTRTVVASRPAEPVAGVSTGLMGCPLVVELTHPAIALSAMSRASLYVQTAGGRALRPPDPNVVFDVDVPGTVRVEMPPGDRPRLDPPPGYRDVSVGFRDDGESALDYGVFTFVVPTRLGAVPAATLVTPPAKANFGNASAEGPRDENWSEVVIGIASFTERGRMQTLNQRLWVPALSVRGGDRLYLGYAYADAQGSNRWITAEAELVCDPLFDIMDRRYQAPVESLHVGETLYARVRNADADRTDEKDRLTVQVEVESGDRKEIELTETLGHSGVFKGLAQILYAGDPARSNQPSTVAVNYGDRLEARYLPAGATQPLVRVVRMLKGDDGQVLSFTKRFKDPSIAVQTQFTIAEAYFEMAKKHRELGQEELARREIGQGKKLLEEAIRDYPDTESRAQADYLLADLALEFANQASGEEQKTKFHLEAVTRFSDIVASSPDSPYAPKSQFKKALTFEKMGRMDDACEEYVKLSYRYPDNELVAETIARLGQYFLSKGKALQDKMAAETDIVAAERLRLQASEMYKTAAQVFARLSVRFPDHKLASKATVLSAQCFMRAEDFPRAIATFTSVIDAKKAEPELIAEAMYWCGDTHVKSRSEKGLLQAYRMFKKLTWDYPESVWAKYARGRLTEQAFARMDEDLAR